mmetsp:Transcript_55230/g.59829  ORF Transcript_55230/g.59829 Transcript_55230/m.59829 type:complete len:206 (+) Transcript_55230:87-704(+)
MKILSCLLLGFKWQQRLELTLKMASQADKVVGRNNQILQILDTAGKVGQVGLLASEEDQQLMEDVAKNVILLNEESKPARYKLTGIHTLVYSAAPGASSGRLFGSVVGKVFQLIEDDEIFYNLLFLGPLEVSLKAKREILNDSSIKVSFLETTFKLFGQTLKNAPMGGGGVWKVKFVGTVEDRTGREKLIRIMETPSLFILEQDL